METFKCLDDRALPAANVLNVLEESLSRARQGGGGRSRRPTPAGTRPGTTLTAMVWTGSQLALVHVGDSRAYLLRDGELARITHDHTFVQSMIDEGRISVEEAASHPQRAAARSGARGGPATGPTCGCTTSGPATVTCCAPTA